MVDVKMLACYMLSLFKDEALQCEADTAEISNLKLQKLLYYCQAYSLALTGQPLFDEEIEAWSYGPVVPSIYQEYKRYGNSNMPVRDIKSCAGIGNETAEGIARLVKRQKGIYTGFALIRQTHGETPWREAIQVHQNAPISNQSMLDYFADKVCEELPKDEEDRLWASVSTPLSQKSKERLRSLVL